MVKNFGISRPDQSFIKLVAMITMICDHTALALVPAGSSFKWTAIYWTMRLIGRIAAPLFFYLLASGVIHTSNPRGYLGRLLIFAIISEIPFNLMVSGSLFDMGHQNIFVTLFLAAAALFAAREVKKRVANTARNLIFSCLIYAGFALMAQLVRTDYGWYGIVMAAIFYEVLLAGDKKLNLWTIIPTAIEGGAEIFAVAALPFILLDGGERGKLGRARWCYAVYPAHILMLCVIRAAIR